MIRFLAPAALWGLLLLPVIILLYMLRSRREPMPVSSVLLWQRTRRDLAAQLPIRRLERSVLLALQLLALAAAVLALAQPQVRLPSGSGQATVVVMDLSASMQATDMAPSRFEAARRRAIDLVRATRGPVMVITAGAQPSIALEWTDRGGATGFLSRLQPTDGPAALDQAMGLALAQRSPGKAGVPRVVVFTDGAGRSVDAQVLPGVQFVVLGSASRNLGITRLHTELTADGTHVVVQIINTGSRSEQVQLRILLDNRQVHTQEVRVAARSTIAATALVKAIPSGAATRQQGNAATIRAEITSTDALPVDNVAYGLAGQNRPRVLVLGDPDRVIDEALAAVGTDRITAARITAETLARADVVVLNGTPPVPLPPGNYLLVGTSAPNLPLAVDGVVKRPVILRWSRTHQVLRFVDLSGIQIAEALNLRATGGDILAEGEVPVIWAYSGRGIRALVLGFSLANSDLALHAAFPILLSNALDWLAGTSPVVDAGQPLVLFAGSEEAARLIEPNGSARTLRARDGVFAVPSLNRAGVYTLVAGQIHRHIAVNVPPEESEITPTRPPTLSGSGEVAAAGERTTSLWLALAAFALAVLVLEWLLWLRTLPKAITSRRTGPSRALRPSSG